MSKAKRSFCRYLHAGTFAYFLVVATVFFSNHAYSREKQEYKVSLTARGIAIANVFTEVRKQTGLVVFYNNDLFNDKEKINVQFVDAPIDKVIQTVIKGKNLSYNITDNYIAIFTKSSTTHTASLANVTLNSADELLGDTIKPKKLTGKVTTDEDGLPLLGASVTILHTKRGTSTNEKGEFSLDVKPGDSVSISYLGKEPHTFLYKAQASVNVRLKKSDKTELDDVIVTGFQKIDRKKFTGSAVTLKADSIRIDGVTDISRMLEGRAAGVSVQNVSGTFGTAPKIRVRGATSITGSNKPLWVVDGVVLEDIVDVSNEQLTSGDASTLLGSSVAGLNINDVETFDILKDASAAALYGARAMNGVIVITTKRGKIGKPIISYTGNFGVQLKPSYKNFDIMSSADMLSVYAEMERKGYINYPDLVNASSSGIFGKLAQLIQTPQADGSFAVANTPEARKAWLMQYANTNTDWFDILFRNSLTQEHSLSISSGTDKMKSYFSTSFFNDQGWTIADNVKRYTVNLNNTYTPSTKLTFGFSIIGSVRQQQSPGTEDRQSNSARGVYARNFDLNPFSYALHTSRVLPAYNPDGSLDYFTQNYAPFNIISETKNNITKTGVSDFALRGNLSYKVVPHLTYEFTGSLRYAKTTQEHTVNENSNEAQAYRANGTSVINAANPYLYQDPANPTLPKIVVLPYGGFYNRADITLSNFSIRNQLNYNNSWGRDRMHQLSVLGGQEIIFLNRQLSSSNGVGYQYGNGAVPYNYYYYFEQLFQNNQNYYGLSNEYHRSVGFYGNVSYTYKGKYTLDGTVREDGSNLLGLSAKTRWLPTWTLASRWNIDQEKFMENSKVFSHLMFKASYGLNANPGNANNSTSILRSMTTNRPYPGDQQPSIYIDQLQNSDLTWEKAYTLNLGLDMGFFKDRLIIVPEYYRRRSFSLIGLVHTSGIAGQVDQYANYADLNSHGGDLTITGRILAKENYNFTSSLTLGWAVNEIANSQTTPPIWQLVGEGGGPKNGYAQRGLFSLVNTPIDNSFYSTGVPTFINESGVPGTTAVNLNSLNTQYLKYEGPSEPIFSGGWYNSFRYKQFSINVLLTYQAGSKIRLSPVYQSAYSDLSSLPNEFKRRWTIPGDEKLTRIPALADIFTNSGNFGLSNIPAYPYTNYNWSHDRVADGGFVRMKSVTVSYQLPANFLNRIGFKSASFSVTANNLWLIYSDSRLHGQDPEFYQTGGVALPVNKQITGSLRIAL